MQTNLPIIHGEIKRLAIWYPHGVQKLPYKPDCTFNGDRFLSELKAVGFQQHPRGETLHLTHPALDAAAEAH